MVAEVVGLEGVGGEVSGLIRLWKSVGKLSPLRHRGWAPQEHSTGCWIVDWFAAIIGISNGEWARVGSFESSVLMIRMLLLDCPPGLTERLKKQGYDVEAGTVGFATGKRRLPCQVYERDVFFYSPSAVCIRGSSLIEKNQIEDSSPEFDLKYLGDRIEGGATFVVFVNRLVDHLHSQNGVYSWIPNMPPMVFSKDKTVHANRFEGCPDSQLRSVAPIMATSELEIPVLQKLNVPSWARVPSGHISPFLERQR